MYQKLSLALPLLLFVQFYAYAEQDKNSPKFKETLQETETTHGSHVTRQHGYYVFYEQGKGDVDAIVIINQTDTLELAPNGKEDRSYYYFDYKYKYRYAPVDLTIIHPDYPVYEHVQKKMHTHGFRMVQGSGSIYYALGMHWMQKWDKKTICVTTTTGYPNGYYHGDYNAHLIRDSVRHINDSIIEDICQKFGLVRKTPFFPPKRHFFNDFDLYYAFLLQRKDGTDFTLENADWIRELHQTPMVNKVLLPTTVNTEDELEGPHVPNQLIIEFKSGTTDDRINEIVSSCGLGIYNTFTAGTYSTTHCRCNGPLNKLVPSKAVIKRLLSIDDVVKLSFELERYNDMRG